MSENDSERVKSKAMIDSSDSDSDMSDSEFQNVAKKPKLDLSRVRIQNQDMKVTIMMIMHAFFIEIWLLLAQEIFFQLQFLRV